MALSINYIAELWGRPKEHNIVFFGLGGIGLTQSQFLEGTSGITAVNILKWEERENDLYLLINKKFGLQYFATKRSNFTNATHTLIGNNSRGILDLEGVIEHITGSSYYDTTLPTHFTLPGLLSIGNEGFRNVRGMRSFIANRLSVVGNAGTSQNGTNNGGVLIDAHFPMLTGDVNFSTAFRFHSVSPLVTGSIFFQGRSIGDFPFPNATSLQSQAMRNSVFAGEVNLYSITGDLNGDFAFYNTPNITHLRIPNASRIIQTRQTFDQMNSLVELDIRGCTEVVPHPSQGMGRIFNRHPRLTIHANDSVRVAATGVLYDELMYAQSGGVTIVWH